MYIYIYIYIYIYVCLFSVNYIMSLVDSMLKHVPIFRDIRCTYLYNMIQHVYDIKYMDDIGCCRKKVVDSD